MDSEARSEDRALLHGVEKARSDVYSSARDGIASLIMSTNQRQRDDPHAPPRSSPEQAGARSPSLGPTGRNCSGAGTYRTHPAPHAT